MKRIVIFDMDGTLIDSQHDITVSINHVREARYGLPPLSTRYVVDAINAHRRNLPKLFYEQERYLDEDRALFEAHYHEQCVKNPSLYDGIEALLISLRARQVLLSVATNAPSTFARRMLTHLGVAEHFDAIVGADRVAKPKPDTDMLDLILGGYGFDAGRDRAWMVGDNSKDIEAARRAKITGVFATWGFSPEGEGDHVVSHPDALHEIVR